MIELVRVFDFGICFAFSFEILDLFFNSLQDASLMLNFFVDSIRKIVVLLWGIDFALGSRVHYFALGRMARLDGFQPLFDRKVRNFIIHVIIVLLEIVLSHYKMSALSKSFLPSVFQ